MLAKKQAICFSDGYMLNVSNKIFAFGKDLYLN